jgi:hypothetical protein
MDRGFIKQSLTQFGFGDYFLRWFVVLHAQSVARVTINGFLTEPFAVESGVRQGCPWAPFLFLCAIEPLACSLRSSNLEGLKLPDGKRVIYSGYADDTTLFLSGVAGLYQAIPIFDKYSSVSGMKSNTLKCSIIPLGTLIDVDPPIDCPFEWLADESDPESLLGVPVGVQFQDDLIWKSLLNNLSESIKHWSLQNLSVYGRVHAARSYIGGQAWFLATMIPLNTKGLKRLSAMLWSHVQNNKQLDIKLDSNQHYSPWSRISLCQNFSEGGLNAQNPEHFLTALHSKWIFKLLDPRHLASWKALPFYFLRNLIKGLGDSVFLTDPTILKTFPSSLPSRWHSYLHSWFSGGLLVAPPPLDYECILNEPIWFNRFLYLPTDDRHGRLLNKDLEKWLVNRGFTHLKNLRSRSPPAAGSYESPCLSPDEAIFEAGSRQLGAALSCIIELSPPHWSYVVMNRSREPFQCGDWIVRRDECHGIPSTIYSIVEILPHKLSCIAFQINCSNGSFCYNQELGKPCVVFKSQITKAAIIKDTNSNQQIAFYYGNYSTSKLLLSRFNWKVDNKLVSFPNITVKVIYNSILQAQPFTNKAIEKWSTHFNEPIYWHDMIKYINRGRLLENKTKEKLYKIYTRALPVGRKMSGPNGSTSCPFCSIYEDEMHSFIICKRLESLWKYVKTMLISTCRWTRGGNSSF